MTATVVAAQVSCISINLKSDWAAQVVECEINYDSKEATIFLHCFTIYICASKFDN